MNLTSPSIGKFDGISIELHWTFILLLLFSLLIGTFFFLVILLLFVCVLIHELAHSVTARRNRISVKKIVLLPIGGASIIDDVKIDPKLELNIALAGPVMSLFLGFVFGAISTITPPGPITLLAQSLFELNIFMGVFNILPAFPMDGGRVFRSYLQRTRDYYSATMLTVKISKYLMGLIILITLAFVAFANSYSLDYREFIAFWNFIIIMFLYGGAQGEEQNVILRKETEGLVASDTITRDYLLVNSQMGLGALYRLIKARRKHIVITKIGQKYLLVNILRKLKDPSGKLVRDISVQIPQVSPKLGVVETLGKMQSSDSEAVAVVERGRLVGIATGASMQAYISVHLMGKKTT
ncbi:MAG: hypothetical protein KGH71_04010 [Candidatus Micrarchaeota archaeon]|nr:hypothetical protein [Candidatus Micrarchaeota archaeon]